MGYGPLRHLLYTLKNPFGFFSGPVLGFIVCAYGLTKQGRPSHPAFGFPGANVVHGGRLITVWTGSSADLWGPGREWAHQQVAKVQSAQTHH
jgi:hypothetical protein